MCLWVFLVFSDEQICFCFVFFPPTGLSLNSAWHEQTLCKPLYSTISWKPWEKTLINKDETRHAFLVTKPSIEVKRYYRPSKVEAHCQIDTTVLLKHSKRKQMHACVVQTLIKSPYRPFMWVLLQEPELQQRWVLHPCPHSALAVRAWGCCP